MRKLYVLVLTAALVFTASSCQSRSGNVVLLPILDKQVFDLQPDAPSHPYQPDNSGIPSQPEVTIQPAPPDESGIFETYIQLPYYDPSKAARYIDYMTENPDLEYRKAVLYVNIGLGKPFYTQITEVEDTDNLGVLVNKYHALPSDYVPELVELPQSLCTQGTGRQYLREEALDAFQTMHDAAEALGLKVTACGTYRSIELQNWIWQREVNKGRTIEDVDSLNARGGHSEHHTGLAVDVIISNYSVEKTEEFKWYKNNCHKYGFIIRYTEGEESITGYAYEPWHLRYLGKDLAVLVHESGLTYEEYYELELEPQISLKDTRDIHSSILVYPL